MKAAFILLFVVFLFVVSVRSSPLTKAETIKPADAVKSTDIDLYDFVKAAEDALGPATTPDAPTKYFVSFDTDYDDKVNSEGEIVGYTLRWFNHRWVVTFSRTYNAWALFDFVGGNSWYLFQAGTGGFPNFTDITPNVPINYTCVQIPITPIPGELIDFTGSYVVDYPQLANAQPGYRVNNITLKTAGGRDPGDGWFNPDFGDGFNQYQYANILILMITHAGSPTKINNVLRNTVVYSAERDVKFNRFYFRHCVPPGALGMKAKIVNGFSFELTSLKTGEEIKLQRLQPGQKVKPFGIVEKGRNLRRQK